MSSLLFYNVENSKNKEKTLEWSGVCKLFTCTVCPMIMHYVHLHTVNAMITNYSVLEGLGTWNGWLDN